MSAASMINSAQFGAGVDIDNDAASTPCANGFGEFQCTRHGDCGAVDIGAALKNDDALGSETQLTAGGAHRRG